MATIPKTPTKLSPEEAARTIGNVLTRAREFDSPAIIVVEFPSEHVRQAAVEALNTYLAGTDDALVEIDLRKQQDLFETVADLAPNQVASIHGLHAQPELVRRLNWRREFLTENRVRAVFWLNFEELKDLIARAPDFWDFRNRHLVLEPSPQEATRGVEPTYYSFGSLELSNLSAQAKADRIEALEELLAGTDDPMSPRAQAIRENLAQLLWQTGRYSRSIEHFSQAYAISREVGDKLGEGTHLGNLGNAYAALGKLAKAINYYQQALAIHREVGNRYGEGNDLNNLGLAYYYMRELEKAVSCYEEALPISRGTGYKRVEGSALGNLGLAYYSLGEVEKAVYYYQQALAIYREIGDKYGEGNALGNLGLAYYRLGEVQRAIDYHKQALATSRDIGDKRNEGNDLANLGLAYAALGKTQEAIALSIPALIIFSDIQSTTAQKVIRWLSALRKQHEDFDQLLRALFSNGDALLRELTGQPYTFYRDAPPDLPERVLAMLDAADEAAP